MSEARRLPQCKAELPSYSNKRPEFIAEVGSNHNQSFDRAVRLITEAKRADFDTVKFQLFKVEDLYAPEILAQRHDLRRQKDWELPSSFVSELRSCANALGLAFSCTPFSIDAVEFLADKVDYLKIGSYELLWSELLIACSSTRLPLVISTGMANLSEVNWALDLVRSQNSSAEIRLMHCISAYPASIEEANLAAIQALKKATGLDVGWSDHTRRVEVIQRAVHHWGADLVEMHFDLDNHGLETAAGHCWLSDTAKELILGIRHSMLADGVPEKFPAASENLERRWRADPEDGFRPLKIHRNALD